MDDILFINGHALLETEVGATLINYIDFSSYSVYLDFPNKEVIRII